MLTPPRQVYIDSKPFELTIFDVRIPGAAERLQREAGAWRTCSEIEVLDADHVALIVYPGALTRRLAS